VTCVPPTPTPEAARSQGPFLLTQLSAVQSKHGHNRAHIASCAVTRYWKLMLITRKLLLAIAGILLGGRPALQASFSTSVMVLGYIVHQRASPFLQVNNSSTRDHGVAAKLVLRQAAGTHFSPGATLPGSSDSSQLISSSLKRASTAAMAAAGASSPCKDAPHVVGSTRDRLQQRVQAIARPKATSPSGALSVAPKSTMAFFNADYNLFESAFLINSVSARAFPPTLSESLPASCIGEAMEYGWGRERCCARTSTSRHYHLVGSRFGVQWWWE
jgi:hypothetical protein